MDNKRAMKRIIGTVIVEKGKCFIKMENGNLVELKDEDFIEVRNGNEFHRIKFEVLINTKSGEGNPAFSGMDCQAKITR
ncbi:hypothetical protein [Metabacillus sediminilitoris]|uniref:Uncharacterized protein n=1 Tax=Metabacillus sediminilitoris TaxID=2567941 RepID=A0A4S4BPL0_9BACI|nr:hypothetical protein [Metabacillus sediminilitoris]QGQ47700.1 hypothetical protein GMB29_22045 [Metabacillus sediminilitoris]THF76805.1 hypothetical protein E6W99_20645 [Metabacillus sediminilitoris]